MTSPSSALPDVRLNHLLDLSDDTGILQHATFTIPNRSEGYCVDDNARALLLTTYMDGRNDVALLQSRYLSFVLDAFNPQTGRFRNFMSYQREWLEETGSEDSQGRSLWSLGAVVNRAKDVGRNDVAKDLFLRAAPAIADTSSLRTWAYGILACEEYLSAFPRERSVSNLMETLVERLWEHFQFHCTDEWPWFEQRLTYANARLSQALIMGGQSLSNKEMINGGLESLRWLMQVQTGPAKVFAPIGSNGFYAHGGERSFFDQQPVEAASSLSACLTAYHCTGDSYWLEEAQRTFRWFLGENMLGQPLYDSHTGGCHDGLHAGRVNRNQGAESTLSFLCALAELRALSVKSFRLR